MIGLEIKTILRGKGEPGFIKLANCQLRRFVSHLPALL